MSRTRWLLVALAIVSFLSSAGLAIDKDSWKKPLGEKAAVLEKMVLERHSINGLYPSQVDVWPDGHVDITTTGHCDVTHAVNWTSYYTSTQVLRWQITKDPAVRDHVRQLFDALHILHVVNDRPGTVARGWHLGHGPTYEERSGRGANNRWFQGKGSYENLRVRGFPSHHTYSGISRAHGMLYDFFCNDEEKEILRQDVATIAREVYIKNKGQIINHDGSKGEHLLSFTFPGKPSERSLFYTCALGVAAHITGAEDIRRAYKQAVETYRFLDFADGDIAALAAVFPHPIDNDDGDHLFGHLYNMIRIEKDPKLLEFYRRMADVLWGFHKNDRQAYYNLVYKVIRPEADTLPDALWWFKYYPTVKFHTPRLNSIRPGIDKLPRPLPLSERPFDNEYDFKGDPYLLDGWLSREIIDVEVAAEDPFIRFAVDEGGRLYRTLDGGRTWFDHFIPLAGARVNDVLISRDKARLLLAATDRGLRKSDDAGNTWFAVDLPGPSEPIIRLLSTSENPERVIAATPTRLYVSVDMSQAYFGEVWESRQCHVPPGGVQFLTAAVRDARPMLYGCQGQQLWTRPADSAAWMPRGLIHPEVRATYRQLAVHPTDPQKLLAAIVLSFESRSINLLIASTDGGNEWKITGRREIFGYPLGQGSGLENASPLSAAFDPQDGNRMYVGAADNFYCSTDGGLTFTPAADGLDIPRVWRIFPNAVPGVLFASTPAGLYLSNDKGKSWQPGNLILQFENCLPREVGPGDTSPRTGLHATTGSLLTK
jgi:photosystem II stability/assembly factor-like uncharacterized protein